MGTEYVRNSAYYVVDKTCYVHYIMDMSGQALMDASILHTFCASLPAAEQQASREAANTGGVVLQVKSIAIESSRVIIIGLLPLDVPVSPSESSSCLRPRSIGNLYLTWESLLHPKPGGDIGYLVLQTPLLGDIPESESEEGGYYWVALPIERVYYTLSSGSIGATCCIQCNKPISQQLLTEFPTTKLCLICRERRLKWKKCSKTQTS